MTEPTRVITSIAVQKRRKDRFNLYINDTFACAIAEETFLRYQLAKGMPVTPELWAAIQDDTAFQELWQVALNYLSYSARSEVDVRKKLRQWYVTHHEPAEDIPHLETVIDKLKTMRYLDDAEYVKQAVQSAINQGVGPALIRQKLQQKGIDTALIQQQLDPYDDAAQLAGAIRCAEKFLEKTQKHATRTHLTRLRQHLHQKGYHTATIDDAIAHCQYEPDTDKLQEIIRKTGEKLLRRLSKKYDAAQLKYQLKTALYQRGFEAEEIQYYIEELEERDQF